MRTILFGFIGLICLISIAFLFSNNKKKINWRIVIVGILLQLFFAIFVILFQGFHIPLKSIFFILFIAFTLYTFSIWYADRTRRNIKNIKLKMSVTGSLLFLILSLFPFGGNIIIFIPGGEDIFNALSKFFVTLIGFTTEGSRFIFGIFASQKELEKILPADMKSKGFAFVFAFQVLPTIIFFSSLMSVLYYLGIMQKIVQGMAWVMAKAMRVSGAESLSVAANVFVGQTEAPLVVRPFISIMTKSELLTLMVGGMATIAGGVLAAYVNILGGGDPQMQIFYAKHLLSASIMAAPATFVIAKVLIPEVEVSQTMGQVKIRVEKTSVNVIDAAATGASDGMKLALNVAAMLLAFIALIAMVNYVLEFLSNFSGLTVVIGEPLTMNLMLGYLLSPLAWIIGVPWGDSFSVGTLIGQKVVLNEFIAYVEFSNLIQNGLLSEKARIIATYALCGFANFSSIAIQIGGIGGIAPNRRGDLAKFGLRAVLGGSLATLMTATIAGVLIS